MTFNSDFYFVERHPRKDTDDNLKSPFLSAWNNTDIQPTTAYDVFTEQPEIYCQTHINTGGIWHVVTQIKSDCKDKPHIFSSWTRPYCILDIDDLALKKPSNENENNLYNPELDNSPDVKTRYALSYKILYALISENEDSNKLISIWKSTKGFHILARFNDTTVKYIKKLKLKLSNEFCQKYEISESERARADIDVLQHHQILKQGDKLKTHKVVCNNSTDVPLIPENFLTLENDNNFYEAIIRNIRKSYTSKTNFIAGNSYRNYIKGAFYRYLELRGIKPDKQIRCVFHSPDYKPSLSIDNNLNLFYCHACGLKGNLTQFVALYENCTNKEANQILDNLDLRE